MPVLVGTSGWQYPHWRGSFYPSGLGQRAWLEHYASRFATVEVNNAFYRLPSPSTFADWARRTPPDFVFAVKMSRYLTHVRRLRDPAEPVARLLEAAGPLGPKLGPVLLQLPPTLRKDLRALDEVLSCFSEAVAVAVEFRHASWFEKDTAEVLAAHGAALCLVDREGVRTPPWRTAPFGYLRFHVGSAFPPPCYGRRALVSWARRLAAMFSPDEPVYAFFNNDGRTCAVRDAVTFAAACAATGLLATRVPAAGEVRLGP